MLANCPTKFQNPCKKPLAPLICSPQEVQSNRSQAEDGREGWGCDQAGRDPARLQELGPLAACSKSVFINLFDFAMAKEDIMPICFLMMKENMPIQKCSLASP